MPGHLVDRLRAGKPSRNETSQLHWLILPPSVGW